MENEQKSPFMVLKERPGYIGGGKDQTPMQSMVFLTFYVVFMELG